MVSSYEKVVLPCLPSTVMVLEVASKAETSPVNVFDLDFDDMLPFSKLLAEAVSVPYPTIATMSGKAERLATDFSVVVLFTVA